MQIGKKEMTVRSYFAQNHAGRVPADQTVQQLYTAFMLSVPDANVSYGLFNGVIKKIRGGVQPGGPLPATHSLVQVEPEIIEPIAHIEPEIIEIGQMEFQDFRVWRTGSLIDKIFSDDADYPGLVSGTANIVIGESGVGKSTVTLDILAKIRREQPDAKILYISSEMTRNDLYFYYRKTPIIGNIPTLLLMDYIMGRFDQVLEDTLTNGDHDVILIDSHQDIIVKLADILGWKTTRAGTWLTNLIIEAADKKGKTVLAIQHMTKGGQYVGSTYLKHATTGMMEIRKDEAGRRYVEFSKNRRGGSMIDKRLYFSLQNGEVVWDEVAWRQENEVAKLTEQEQSRQAELETEFNSLFLSVTQPRAEVEPDADEDVV